VAAAELPTTPDSAWRANAYDDDDDDDVDDDDDDDDDDVVPMLVRC
jgi:hypothetical protein